ncbi:MAG TPA: hypothetical protein DHN33_06840 [Eubacteriaceae bacterium]|nr:hypothetical protein [Eubacteriaceae bacterium]
MKNDKCEIGHRIQHLLKKHRLKQIDVCMAAGISKNAMSNYVCGNRIPDTYALYKLAKVFRVSMEWLLTGEESQTDENITPTEKSFLDLYRQLTDDDREDLIMLANFKYSRRKKT